MNPFLALALAAAVSTLVISLVWRLAPRLGLLDMPDPRKVHATPVPRVGGWGITIGSLAALSLLFELTPLLQSFLLGSATLFIFGVWDDAKQIGHWPKFFGQILAAGLLVYYGDLYVSRLPFIDGDLDPAIGRPFTMFAVIGVINAINHSDGLDGLAAGESMLSLIAIAILGNLADAPLLLGISVVIIGALLGFLRYNSHPAQVFMGDAGSQVLGFSLAFLTLYLTQAAHTAVSAALPLLLLGLPIADILAVLFQRIRSGSNWFRASRNHVHHRLLDLGFSHYESVVLIYSIQAALVVSAVLMRYESDLDVTATYLVVIACLFTGLIVGERRGWRVSRRATGKPAFASVLRILKGGNALQRTLATPIAAGIAVFILVGAVGADRVPRDFAVIAAALAIALAIELLRTRASGSLFVRTVSYITLIFSPYLMIHYAGVFQRPVEVVATAIVVLLVIAIGLYVRFASEERFDSTPTDFLVALGVLGMAVFGSISGSSRDTVELVVSATVLMYAYEVVSRLPQQRALHLLILATLAIMAVRGVF